MKTLGFTAKQIRKIVEDNNGAQFLGRIGGLGVSYFTGENANGEWIGFKGRFVAVNKDNQAFESGVAFLPAAVANTMREMLDQGVVEVEIQVDVHAEESDKNASGYAYLCEPVLSERANDQLEKLKKSIFKDLPLAIENKTKQNKAA